MKAEDLVKCLEERGIKVVVKDGQPFLRGRQEAVTELLKKALAIHRERVVALVLEREKEQPGMVEPGPPTTDPRGEAKKIQEALELHDLGGQLFREIERSCQRELGQIMGSVLDWSHLPEKRRAYYCLIAKRLIDSGWRPV